LFSSSRKAIKSKHEKTVLQTFLGLQITREVQWVDVTIFWRPCFLNEKQAKKMNCTLSNSVEIVITPVCDSEIAHRKRATFAMLAQHQIKTTMKTMVISLVCDSKIADR
jgi:hypothetical protein